jgi:hypothetical protein
MVAHYVAAVAAFGVKLRAHRSEGELEFEFDFELAVQCAKSH